MTPPDLLTVALATIDHPFLAVVFGLVSTGLLCLLADWLLDLL